VLSRSESIVEEDPVESELELVGGMFDQPTDENVLLQILPMPQFLPGYQVLGMNNFLSRLKVIC
jgi:hypothetical protein